MGDGFWRQARHVFSSVEKGGKKQPSTFILLVLITLGIVFMFFSAQPKQFTAPPPVAGTSEVIARPSAVPDFRESLERDLATLLRRVRGVGDVVVMVTMESGPVFEYAESRDVSARTTQEEDSGGGARQVTESTERKQPVIARTETNREAPLVIREMQPRVGGVIVIAEGAEDPVLREQLFRAVQASLNLAAHRITVLPMK